MSDEAMRLARMLRRNAQRLMTDALAHPLMAQSIEHICGAATINDFRRVLFEPFERERGLNPFLTMREFLARPDRRAMARALFGEDGITLMIEHSGPRYFETRRRVLGGLTSQDGPMSQWFAWGHWGRDRVPVVLDKVPRLLTPVDFPDFLGRYPRFESLGRPRLVRNFFFVELNTRLAGAVDIPVNGRTVEILTALNLPYNATPRPVPGLGISLTDLQVLKLYVTGEMPAVQTRLLPAGSAAPEGFVRSEGRGHRGAADARWEIASRLNNYELVLSSSFDRIIANYPQAASTQIPLPFNPANPFTNLSLADLVAIARYDRGCLEVVFQTFEISHRRAQRAIPEIQAVFTALDEVVDTSLLSHLCGLCDPRNLTFRTPLGHGDVDLFAHSRQVAPRVWIPNPVRARTPYVPWESHQGFPASVNVFEDFDPYQLTQVASMLTQPAVMDAIQRAAPEAVEAYNHLAGSITAVMHAHEMRAARYPLRFVNGEWL